MEPTTIRARNKKTGEVFQGTVEEARQFGFSDEFILKKLKTAKELEKELEPEKEVKPLQKSQDILDIAEGLPTGGERTALTDTVVFANEIKDALKRLDEAEAGGLPGASGPITNIVQKISGGVGIDTPEAALKDKLKNLVQLIRKERTGVQFSKQEQEELTEIFGSIKTQEAPLRRKLEDILSSVTNEIAVKANLDREEVDKLFEVEAALPVKREKEKRNPILEFFAGSSIDLARDVGTGLALKGETGEKLAKSNQKTIEMANRAFQRAQQETDPAQKEKLLEVSRKALEEVGMGSEDIQGLFSEKIEQSPARRGFESAAEITAIAEAPALAKAVFKKAANLKSAVSGSKQVTKNKSMVKELLKGGEIRKKAAQEASEAGKFISGDDLVDAAEAALKDATGDEVRYLEKMVTNSKELYSGKQIDPTDGLNLLIKSGKKSFTKSGAAKATSRASYNLAIRESLRKQFKDIAPEVIKGTTGIANKMKLTKNIRNYVLQPVKFAAGFKIADLLTGGKLLRSGQ